MSSYFETSDKLTSQVVDMRLEYDEVLKIFFGFMTWKNSKDGRKAYFPILEESHKEILFADRDSQLRQAEKETRIAVAAANSVV